MALTKRVYTDGETIITAQNLNDIQDEVIAHESNKVPITRTVNGKALSSNITLSASDVSAVPTTRTVNSKALSSNITLTAADVSAVPTTRTVNSKALSSDITLTSGDIGYNSSTTYSSGTVGKAVSDLNGALNQIGTVIMGSDVTNELRTAQVEEIKTATLTNGTWLLFGYVTFTEYFPQRASIYIMNGSATLAQFNGTGDFAGPVSCFAAFVVNDNLGTKDIKLKIYQTSGVTQYVNTGRLTCVKLK